MLLLCIFWPCVGQVFPDDSLVALQKIAKKAALDLSLTYPADFCRELSQMPNQQVPSPAGADTGPTI
jgi:hypothetical protein